MSSYFATKYDSAAAEVVALLADEIQGYGSRTDATGEVDAPTGYVALVTIPADVDLTTDDEASEVATEHGVTAIEVAGSHLVTWNSQGFVSVDDFATEAEAREVFDQIAAEYAEWDDEDES